jgi:hypothetical protein
MYLAAEGLLLFVDPVEWGRPRGLAGTGRHQRLVRRTIAGNREGWRILTGRA